MAVENAPASQATDATVLVQDAAVMAGSWRRAAAFTPQRLAIAIQHTPHSSCMLLADTDARARSCQVEGVTCSVLCQYLRGAVGGRMLVAGLLVSSSYSAMCAETSWP